MHYSKLDAIPILSIFYFSYQCIVAQIIFTIRNQKNTSFRLNFLTTQYKAKTGFNCVPTYKV